MMIRKNSLITGLTVLAVIVASPVSAETLKFKADLRGSSEVPPNDSAGKGTGDITLDTATKKLTWTVTSSGLSGDATAAHFHGPAAAGENAGPVVDISNALASGSAEITDQHMTDLQAGKWYLNIHTEKFPDGEIRGQVGKAQ
ncbi:CHRD domain-containing protein (plasmid) [Rhizobium etli 8C-3]|uniref:CHRD domain-containing protein n=2 Tax=Rhizobium TaxID=379 RepID=A0A1L5PCR2_RHIET|nr:MULTISPECIES: CHRD domain-containing protein [Rhizobium]APO77905.1 CHRD domain-containing protein [Rhizobium etli 8C-3]